MRENKPNAIIKCVKYNRCLELWNHCDPFLHKPITLTKRVVYSSIYLNIWEGNSYLAVATAESVGPGSLIWQDSSLVGSRSDENYTCMKIELFFPCFQLTGKSVVITYYLLQADIYTLEHKLVPPKISTGLRDIQNYSVALLLCIYCYIITLCYHIVCLHNLNNNL